MNVQESVAGAPSPPEIVELAEACVRFVHRVTNVTLDYTLETLPVLDHYIRDAASAAADKEEARDVVVLAAGAYFGELVRRRYASWWRLEEGTAFARIEFATMFLAFSPMEMARDAVRHHAPKPAPVSAVTARDVVVSKEDPPEDEDRSRDASGFELDEDDQALVEARLAELPAATADEFYAPSTRLEVLDIVVDAIRSKRLAEQDPELALEPADYDD